MVSTTSLCVVQKSAPSIVLESVSDQHRRDLERYYTSGRYSRSLLEFLGRAHEGQRWIICSCHGTSLPITERPALTIARNASGKLHLRNLTSRQPHAPRCPFGYEPSSAETPENERSRSARAFNLEHGKPLNLHRPVATALVSKSKNKRNNGRDAGCRSKEYPRLGRVLLHLMSQSGMLSRTHPFDFPRSLDALRAAAGELEAYAGTSLNDVLRLSASQKDELIADITARRKSEPHAYGLIIVVIHEVRHNPLTLVRVGGSQEVVWECQPKGEVKVWSRRSISRGPFLAAITFAAATGREHVEAQHAFVLPIAENRSPLPVESDLERQVAISLMGLAAWVHNKKDFSMVIEKPMDEIEVGDQQCRPDFLIKGPERQAIVEVMGMIDDEDYRDRKGRTHPIMRKLGELIEIGPAIGEDELTTMKSQVLRTVGWRSRRS